MKNVKRILCLAITVLMVMSSVGVFAAFSDVPSTASYEKAVTSLNQLGIIKGYEDGTFKPDNDVTRAEFTAMLMRSMGYGDIGSAVSAELPFSDVSDQDSDISWSIPNISTAFKMGIVNGYEDGTFRPKDNVLYEEAVKMVVCALGYGIDISVDATPWYSNFVAQAQSMGLLKNAQNLGTAEKPASRACIAQMLYDALEIPLVENNTITTKTLLSDYLGYIKGTGYVSANNLTSLEDPDVNLRDNQIQIRAKEPNSSSYEIHTYQTTNSAELMDKLGYQIDFFYQKPSGTDTIRNLFSYAVRDNNILELSTSQIEKDDSTATSIKYFPTEDASRQNASLAGENIVIYNGKLYGSNANESRFDRSMIPNVGTVTLLDSDKDGKYDLVTIWDYQLYYVSSKSTSDSSIVDNVTRVKEKNLTLDINAEPNLSIVDKNGATVSFGSISTGNVVCYAESNHLENGGTKYAKAVVVTDKVTGSITSNISGEEMTVSGKTYKYSDAAPWMENGNDAELTEPALGDNGSYSLDIVGNVFAYSKTETNTKMYYGYIIAYDNGSGGAFASLDDVQFKVLTQNGDKTDFHVYKGTTLNGKTISTADSLLNELRDSASYQKTGDTDYTDFQQVIKYTTTSYKGNNCLESIYTVTSATFINDGQTVVNDKLYNFSNLNYGNTPLKYYSSGNRLSSTDAGSNKVNLTVNSSTYVFTVPVQGERGDYDKFSKKSISAAFSNNKTYDSIETFDVSVANSAKIVVIYGASASTDVDDSSPVYLINAVPSEDTGGPSGDNQYKISGLQFQKKTANEFDEWVSPSSRLVAKNSSIGDIYRVGRDSDGNITLDSDYRLYPSSKGYINTGSSKTSDWMDAEFCAIYGSIYAKDSDAIVVVPEYLNAGDEASAETYTFSKSNFSSAKYYKYTNDGGKTKVNEVKSNETENVFDNMNTLEEGQNPTKVLIYMSDGIVRLLAVTEG